MKNRNKSDGDNSNINNNNPIKPPKFQLTEKQKYIFDLATQDKNFKAGMIDALWGTGKSFLTTLIALNLLYQNKVNKIIFLRKPAECSLSIGFTPGSIEEKMAPYNRVFFDKLEELIPKSEIIKLQKEGKIECLPIGFIQGLSWTRTAIIVDESSALSFDEILLILSRVAEYSKIFLIGDSVNQNFVGNKSGFRDMFNLLSDNESKDNGIHTFEMQQESDIVRSGFVRFLMRKTGKIKY